MRTLTHQNQCCFHEPWLSGHLSLLKKETKRKLDTYTDRRKERGEGEIKVVLGVTEANAPVTSKAERLLKDGYNRLTP